MFYVCTHTCYYRGETKIPEEVVIEDPNITHPTKETIEWMCHIRPHPLNMVDGPHHELSPEDTFRHPGGHSNRDVWELVSHHHGETDATVQ